MMLEGQKKNASDINMYGDLNGKFKALNTQVKVLETHIAQTSSVNRVPAGILPRKPEKNPKEYVNAITLRSG